MKHTRESLEKMHELELLDAAKPLGLISLTELKPLSEWADACIAEVKQRGLIINFTYYLIPNKDPKGIDSIHASTAENIRLCRDDRQVIIAAILCAQKGSEE